MRISIMREVGSEDLTLPTYQTDGAAGMDMRAAEAITLMPGERAAVSTGLRVAIPDGYEAQIRPRSGAALRQGLSMVNAPGTIDSDYRGPIKVILINLGHEPIVIERGARIAQMVVAPVVRVEWDEVSDVDLSTTVRQDRGFGHTGIS